MPPARESESIHHDFVADRREIARHRQRRRAGADAGDALAVALGRRGRQQRRDVLFVVGGDALEPADGDRLLLEPSSTACRLAWAVAGAPEDPRKHIRLPIDHVGVVIVPGRNLPDIFRDRSMGGAGPLTINDFVKVLGIRHVSRLHDRLPFRPSQGCELVRIHSYASFRAELLKSLRRNDKRS